MEVELTWLDVIHLCDTLRTINETWAKRMYIILMEEREKQYGKFDKTSIEKLKEELFGMEEENQ